VVSEDQQEDNRTIWAVTASSGHVSRTVVVGALVGLVVFVLPRRRASLS
jgi:hypothetical protein